MKQVLYIGNFIFPDGNAAGKRVHGNGKILKELGYEVKFIGINRESVKNICLKKSMKEDDGFEHYSFSYPSNIIDWVKYNELFDSLVRFINENIGTENIEIIVFYGSPSLSFFIDKLIRYCRKNRIKIVADSVDWLTVRTNNPIFDMVKWIDNTYKKVYLNKKADGIITISNYLNNYYSRFGIKTVIIPPLNYVNHGRVKNDITPDKIRKVIVYAGIPFRKGVLIKDVKKLKDRIDKTIILLSKAKDNGAEFHFNIYGFTRDEYLEVLPSQSKYLNKLGNSVKFHGLRRNTVVTKAVSKADFTILIRDVNRDTTAGFPTKVSESISYGTPVITTRTSDLEDYIIEGETGFFIDTKSCDYSLKKIDTILNMSSYDINIMKNNCYNSNLFNYSRYIKKMEKFIDSL